MYYQKEELFWRERQEKLRVLSGLKASTSCHSMVASSIAHPAYSPSLLQTQHCDRGTKVQEGQHVVDGEHWVLKAVPAAQLCLASSNRQQLQLQKHVLALAELRQDLADRVRAAEAGKLAAAERKLAEQRRLERQLETRLRRACSGIEDQEARVQALMQEVDSELHAYSGMLQGIGHQLEEQDLARMATQLERLHRKKAALSLVANTGHAVPISALISKAKQSNSSPGDDDRARGSSSATEASQTNPAHFSALRQAMNMSPGMVGGAGRATVSDWEHVTSLEAADIDLEMLPSADEALQSILGQMEQRHKLSMAQVQQACAAQLTALHDEYSAALEERERGYSELLEELRSLRRRCPSPRDGRTAARAVSDHEESQQVHFSSGIAPREARLFRQGQPAGAAPAALQPHFGCREATSQLLRSRSPPEHSLIRRPAGHNALEHGGDCGRADDKRQHSSLQQQDGDSGRQSGHLKPSRIPSLRKRLVQPCSPREVLDSPGCPSAAKPAVDAVPAQEEQMPAQHHLPAQQHTTPGPHSRSPAELLWPTPPSSSRASSQNKQVLATDEREACRAPVVHHGLKHISRPDLDLILGASEQASEGVAGLLQGLELPM